MSTKMYVYSMEDNQHIATIIGDSDRTIEKVFADRFGDDYGGTYSPAFGFDDGLVENSDAEEIDAVQDSKGNLIDIQAARQLMDDDICDQIHGTVDSEQEFFDAYAEAHKEKFNEEFVIN